MKIELIEDPDIPLGEYSLPHVTSLRAMFCMYGLDYSCGILLVISYPEASAVDATTSSTGVVTVAHQNLNNGGNSLLLDRIQRLKVM